MSQDDPVKHPLRDLLKVPYELDKILRIFAAGIEELQASGAPLNEITEQQARDLLPKSRGNLMRDYVRLDAQDPTWFDLWCHVLQMVGLHITYLSERPRPLPEIQNACFLAFCLAPRPLLTGVADAPFTAKQLNWDADPMGPEEFADKLAAARGKELWADPPPQPELFHRFACEKDDVRQAARRLWQIILHNGFLESWKDPKRGGQDMAGFIHQTLEEYFAAERFGVLFSQQAASFDPDSAEEVPNYLRYRKYDEMLHIVIGTVFHERQGEVATILRYLVQRGARYEATRQCLLKAEFVEQQAQEQLAAMALDFSRNQQIPDRWRAAALRCLGTPRLEVERGVFQALVQDPGLAEAPEAWKALLDQVRSRWTEASAARAMVEQGIVIRCAAAEDGPARRKELLVATAQWVQDREEAGLDQLLVDQLLRHMTDDMEAMAAVWQALTTGHRWPLSTAAWGQLLSACTDASLFARMLSHKFEGRPAALQVHYPDSAAVARDVLRLGCLNQGWAAAVAALLDVPDAVQHQVLDAALEVCQQQGDFPAAVAQRAWKADAEDLLESGFVDAFVAWIMTVEPAGRPNGWAHWISGAFDRTQHKRHRFGKVLPQLTLLAIQTLQAPADTLASLAAKISKQTRQRKAAFLRQLVNVRQSPPAALRAAFNALAPGDESALAAVLVAARVRREELDERALVIYWEQAPAERLYDLVYAGGGGERFVKWSPRLLERALLGISYSSPTQTQCDAVQRLSLGAHAYSTKIVIYTSIGQRDAFRMSHPGHPSYPPGSDGFDSLMRLLADGLTGEAAYILRQHSEHRDAACEHAEQAGLLQRYEEALERTKGFSPAERVQARPFIADRTSDAALTRALSDGSLLLRQDVPKVLKSILADPDGSRASLGLRALARASIWCATGDEHSVGLKQNARFVADGSWRSDQLQRVVEMLLEIGGDSMDELWLLRHLLKDEPDGIDTTSRALRMEMFWSQRRTLWLDDLSEEQMLRSSRGRAGQRRLQQIRDEREQHEKRLRAKQQRLEQLLASTDGLNKEHLVHLLEQLSAHDWAKNLECPGRGDRRNFFFWELHKLNPDWMANPGRLKEAVALALKLPQALGSELCLDLIQQAPRWRDQGWPAWWPGFALGVLGGAAAFKVTLQDAQYLELLQTLFASQDAGHPDVPGAVAGLTTADRVKALERALEQALGSSAQVRARLGRTVAQLVELVEGKTGVHIYLRAEIITGPGADLHGAS